MSSIRISVQERKAVNHDETTYGWFCNGWVFGDKPVNLQAVPTKEAAITIQGG